MTGKIKTVSIAYSYSFVDVEKQRQKIRKGEVAFCSLPTLTTYCNTFHFCHFLQGLHRMENHPCLSCGFMRQKTLESTAGIQTLTAGLLQAYSKYTLKGVATFVTVTQNIYLKTQLKCVI